MYWLLWLLWPMKKKVAQPQPPHELPATQRHLFHCIGRAIKHVGITHELTHADCLRVFESYRFLLTEDWIHKYPEDVPQITKLLGKS